MNGEWNSLGVEVNGLKMWTRNALGLGLVLACVGLLMGADRRIIRAPAALGEMTLLSGASGTFDVVAANFGEGDLELVAVNSGSLGSATFADGIIHYSAHADASGTDRVGYQLVTPSGQRRLGELRVRVVDANAQVSLRIALTASARAGVPVELRDGATVVASGVTRGDGVVDLGVSAGWPGEAMLSLHAETVGAGGDTLAWVSLLGSVRQLREAAAGARLDPSTWAALRLGAASTVFHATMLDIDPGAVVDETAAMSAAAGVDPHRLLIGATLVDLIEAGTLPLSPGYADTHALLVDAAEVERMRAAHWSSHVYGAMHERLLDPKRLAALDVTRYQGWMHPHAAHGLVRGAMAGTGMLLRADGEGEYLSSFPLDDVGVQWHVRDGALRVELNQPRVTNEQGGHWLPRQCELPDGSWHTYYVEPLIRRGVVDLRRMHGFAGIDYLVQHWHRVQFQELRTDVPEGCEVELAPEFTMAELSYSLSRPGLDTTVSAGAPVAVPGQLLVGLGAYDLAGLLDPQEGLLDLEDASPEVDVHLARAGRIVFDARMGEDAHTERFELQQLREGIAGASVWAVVRRAEGGAVRGWVSTGVAPQPTGAGYDWDGNFLAPPTWTDRGALGERRREERWHFDEAAQRATPSYRDAATGDWQAYPHLARHLVVEDGAAAHRRYYTNTQGNLLECPPDVDCWRMSEHRFLSVAELADAFGPGFDLVYVMREYGLFEDDDGWGQFQRYVDALVRDPSGNLAPLPPRTKGTLRPGATMQRR